MASPISAPPTEAEPVFATGQCVVDRKNRKRWVESQPRFVGIFRRTIYGISGDKTPPRVAARESFAHLSRAGESEADFGGRMKNIGVAMRAAADRAPLREYSWRDDWGWEIAEVRDAPEAGAEIGGRR